MYRLLYQHDTPKNREIFFNDWVRNNFQKSTAPYFQMSAKTIAINFSRLECEISQNQVVQTFKNNGFKVFQKGENIYFDISPESLGVREIRNSWN